MIKKIIYFFLFLSIFYFNDPVVGHDLATFSQAKKYLEGRIQKKDKRYLDFLLALELLEKVKAKVLIETGTARNGDQNFYGDGGSTIIFGEWAYQNNGKFYSVDISSQAIETAKNATQLYTRSLEFFTSDSVKFLENFTQPIDFLYLDSYDYDYNNPNPSQIHHLKEIIAVYPLLHQKSIVMVDDCDLPQGGKGKLVIDFLLSKGWLVFHQGYQTILIQPYIFNLIY